MSDRAKVDILWLDGESMKLANVDKSHLDSSGNNLLVYRTKLIGGPSVLDLIIPLTNVREVQYR